MNREVRIGTCGLRSPRSKYYSSLDVVELQETFYDLPDTDRLRRLRQEAPPSFEFTVKVFQAITHPRTSPTWRRMRTKLPGNLDNYGYLRPTRENLEIWNVFLERTRPLSARVYVFQTPSSMPATEEAFRWVLDFFKTIRQRDVVVGWEPRGPWCEKREWLLKVVEECDIVHVVDPFRREPVKIKSVTYFRLHGIGGGETNYRYRYTDQDLLELRELVLRFLQFSEKIYVLFNNIYMFEDAVRFRNLIRQPYK